MSSYLPLENIKVLDLTQLLPGPFCSLLLADLGAEVIKVEKPMQGDYARQMAPFIGKESYRFLLRNRNKKSIALNLKTSQAKEIFYTLAKEADVILESFRPGVARRLGVDYETIKKINPGIVYCSISGYGQNGPNKDMPGHDINYVGIAGVLSVTGNKGDKPVLPGIPIADFSSAFFAAYSILAAIIGREKSGKGQYIDVAMTDVVSSLLIVYADSYFAEGKVLQRGDSWMSGGSPYYNIYETKDGRYITIGAVERHFWQRLCKALDREDLTEFQFSEDKKEEVFKILKEIFITKTQEEWLNSLKEADVPCGAVNTIDDVFSNPQIRHRGLLSETLHPLVGKIKQIKFPVKFSEASTSIRLPPPMLGEHTESILQSLGYKKEKIEEMQKKGIIQL